MSFDFNFFDQQPLSDPNNLEEVMKKIQDQSFKFDQFDQFEPVDQNPNQKSFNSDFFKQQPKPSEKMVSAKSRGKSDSVDFQNSRNLSEISYIGDERNNSFRYEQPPPTTSNLKPSSRYEKMQRMLAEAKKNNLDMFYRNLDQQNTYRVQQKFNSKEEFNDYRNQFKAYKREREENFKETNGDYNFRNNRYKNQAVPSKETQNMATMKADFRKKDSIPFNKLQNQSQNKPNQTKNLLPNQLFQEDQGFDFFEIGQDQINKQVKSYQTKEYMKQGEKFFKAQNQQHKDKRNKAAPKLQPIREERANLFQLTHESQKMANLINNYEDMRRDFYDMMGKVKQAYTDQQKIINELKNLNLNKQSKLKIQAQTKKEKKVQKQREKQEKQKKIKQQFSKLRGGDLIFLKLNQKFQNLDEKVKNVLDEINQEKQQKFVPKIIHYYNSQSPHSSRQKSEGAFSRQEGLNQNQTSRIRALQEQQLLAPVRNAIKQLKQEKKEQQILYGLDQFCSPLQLDLTTQQFPLNLSRNRSQQLQQPFVPPEGAKQYLPNTLDTTNKYLRRCLTQKSSVIFQSFEFYVTGKFTMTSNDRYPVLCEVRVANKCAVSLYDVFVVVFGPQAQESQLQMRPNKIMHDEFRHSTSFLFEVDLSKSCLQSGGFSVMISYKTDSVNKKKVVFKVLLPFVQLIKPEFIYQEQFTSGWNHMSNEAYIIPKTLDFKNIRSHQDLKLIMPFIEVGEYDPNAFSYGIMFRYPTSQVAFMMKITCYVNGKASIHLKSSQANGADRKIREEILDIMNYLCFG